MSIGLDVILAGQGDISGVDLTTLPPLCLFQVVRRVCGGLAAELVVVFNDGLNDELLLSRLFVSPAIPTKVQPGWVVAPQFIVCLLYTSPSPRDRG